MAGGQNATVEMTIKIMEEGDAGPMSVTTQTWNGLRRMEVLALERVLIGGVLEATSEMGFEAEVAKGRATKEEVAGMKDMLDKIKGNKEKLTAK